MSLQENINLAMNLVLCGDDKGMVASELIDFVESNYIKKSVLSNLTVEAANLLNNAYGLEFLVSDGKIQEISNM